MEKILIVPDRIELKRFVSLSKEYGFGFEYNDFFSPDVIDDDSVIDDIINFYESEDLPEFVTMHGAFFDVIPFSVDKKIREISQLRINQSIAVARKIGAKAVVFHTNYNPFLSSDEYKEAFVKKNTVFWKSVLSQNSEINIYLENMFDDSPCILKALAENLSEYENFGVCLDWAHAVLSETAPSEWAESLNGYVKHIHINDNDLKSDLHSAWGDGQIDRFAFYDCYQKYLSGATVLIETNSIENTEKSIKQLKKDGVL